MVNNKKYQAKNQITIFKITIFSCRNIKTIEIPYAQRTVQKLSIIIKQQICDY